MLDEENTGETAPEDPARGEPQPEPEPDTEETNDA